uniref:Uncharacterized protein n=1 Tax=Mycena chlorophos TaxID=658473 RepID=A0ABQ0L3Y9_MYCCL|nr:predicted protein [Mycena chlorophos]
MHHSFSLTNLDYVPLSLRKSAKAAAKKSPADLKRIAAHCLSLDTAAPATYLSLVYRNLDPADIPSSTADPETSLAAAK